MAGDVTPLPWSAPKAAAPVVPSDALATLRELLGQYSAFMVFGELVQVLLVVDADRVQGDLRWLVGKRTNPAARTNLQEVVAAGTVIAYAPKALLVEIKKYLPAIAAENGVSEERVQQTWEEYRAILRFYEPEPTPHVKDAPVPVADPKDVPYAELWRQLGAAGVYSRDNHLSAMGVPIVTEDVVTSLRAFSRAASVGLTIKVGGTLFLIVSGGSVLGLAQLLGRAVMRLPRSVQVALAGLIVAILLHPRGRARLAEFIRRGSNALSTAATALGPVVANLGDAETKARAAWEHAHAKLPPIRRRSVLTCARAVCAAAERPLSVAEIERAVRNAGHVSRARSFRTYLRRVMRADQRFVETMPGWWTVSRSLE